MASPVALERMSPWALSRFCMRMVREKRQEPSLWRQVASRAEAISPTMQPGDMSTITFAFARIRYRDRPMMDAIASDALLSLPRFTTKDLTYFFAAYARLEIRKEFLVQLIAREVARKSHDFTPRELSNIVISFGALGFRHDALFDVLRHRIALVAKGEFTPEQLALVVNGFGRLGVRDEELFTHLAAEVCRRIGEFTGKPLALIANGYARLGVKNSFLLDILGHEVFRKRTQFTPQGVAMVLHSFAKLGIPHDLLFDYYVEHLPRRIPQGSQWGLHSLSMVAQAYVDYKKDPSALYKAIGDSVAKQGTSLYPLALANLIDAFARANQPHGLLFYHAPEIVQQGDCTLEQLSLIVNAYGTLHMAHLPLFDQTTKQIGESSSSSLKELEPERLVDFLDAYVRVNVNEPAVFTTIDDQLTARIEQVSTPLLIRAARAFHDASFPQAKLIPAAKKMHPELEGELKALQFTTAIAT
eukprot:GEMP01057045.1.p1 GENE.GEMP01057045.1~~GEMP01057045.1.p1  ORF type:complete len:487 (+),score=109.77 GEMP01057045.1:48-1463(+)